jgi:hypothetical protein
MASWGVLDMLAEPGKWAVAQPADRRAAIDRLERVMQDMPQAEIEQIDTWGPGFYVRTIRAAAGTAIVGRVHKTEHVFALTKGTLRVATEDGEQELTAPAQFVCRPGLKRAGYAVTAIECSNFHITDETDLALLEAELVEPLAQLEHA